jgi:ribokinase
MAPLVLVAGSLHHDVVVSADRLPRLDETLPGSGVRYVFGGKGGNQAVAAARHGATTAMAACVGDDAAGEVLRAALAAAGVDHSGVSTCAGLASGMSVAIVTGQGDYGAVIVTGANAAIDAEAARLDPAARVLVLQNEIPAEANRILARRAADAGLLVIHNAAPARPLDAELSRHVGLLVANRVEAEQLTGQDAAGIDGALAAAARLSSGGATAIVTLGGDGAVLAEPGSAPVRMPGHAVRVVSTHGAGDAFTGALAARLALGAAMAGALAYAQAAAALHVSSTDDERARLGPEKVVRFLAEAPR